MLAVPLLYDDCQSCAVGSTDTSFPFLLPTGGLLSAHLGTSWLDELVAAFADGVPSVVHWVSSHSVEELTCKLRGR